MAITASCTGCQTTFSLRNEFAGKRVKCPKCSAMFQVAASGNTAAQTAGARTAGGRPAGQMAAAGTAAGASRGYNPLMDLLDEAGVQAKARGRACPNCGGEVQPSAVLCVDCGFNLETGQQMRTAVLIDANERGLADDLSDAEKRMVKAEKEIDETPVSSFGQDFGEGNESFLIAIIACVALLIFAGLGVACVLLMDQITQYIAPPVISFMAAIGIYILCAVWLSVIAFMINPGHGIAMICTCGLYGVIFGFMQGGNSILPTVIMLCAILIGLASAIFVFSTPAPDYSVWVPTVSHWLARI